MSSIFQVPELVIGLGLSEAASVAFEPKVEVPRQSAWKANPVKLPDVGLIVALVAGGKVSMDDGKDMAKRLGFSPNTVESLVWLQQNRLAFPEMLRMWRLSAVNPAFDEAGLSELVDKTLAHEQLDWDYRTYLRALKTAELIGLGDIALAIVRGALPTPSWVPVGPPTEGTTIPRYPVVELDPEQLAAALGFDLDMLKIMTARSGLSLAPGLAAQAYFREIITRADAHLAAAEGDLRTEWTDTLIDVSRQILTADQYLEGALRGWTSLADGKAGAARHGMSDEDAQLLYEIRRRPLTPHTITQALERGGQFNPDSNEIQDPYDAAVHQQDLGPEWYDLAKAMKYSPPSAFVIRALLKDGVYTVDHGALRLRQSGLYPEDAQLIAEHYGAQTTTATDPHVTKAQVQLWTTTHRSYIAAESDDATATAALEAAGVDAGSVPAVLALWAHERELVRKQLTPAQIKKGFKEAAVNAETGAAWTRDEALAALIARGYSPTDADSFLNI